MNQAIKSVAQSRKDTAATLIQRKTIVVDGNISLSYLEAGSGKAIVLIPGWSQTADQFKFQIEGLSAHYRVIALDLRGHGDSDKPSHGYRIQRLAKDVHEVLTSLNLNDVTLLGHSMGCTVIWCYFDLFGPDRIEKFVFCDQASFLTSNEHWTEQDIADYGAIFTRDSVDSTVQALCAPDAVDVSIGFLKTMVTSRMPADQFQWIIDSNLKMPRSISGHLLYNHCHQDWRDVLPRITKPSLFIGGKASLVPESCIRWEAAQVKGAQLEIFSEDEGGSHFMFIENPEKFNALLKNFMG
ncbi:alpha/beta fold hydrolase [Herbaspirillum seropedicae]|uniref:alpha/beta fold hydrolase n=1 Tax=Herbaspirillum seropedicae TaxID=964 RepID=UPI003D96A5ED